MASISTFLSNENVRRLTRGSYEQLKTQLESSIDSAKQRLFGSDSPFEILSTFAGHAVVVSEDTKVFRVKYESTEQGDIVAVSAEVLPVDAYSAATADKFVKTEAQAYVDAFFSGARSNAVEKLRELLPHVRHVAVPSTREQVLESFEKKVTRERAWKKVYDESRANIFAAVKEDVVALQESCVSPKEKFHRLYNGSIPTKELSGYSELVTSDLKYLGERVATLLGTAEASQTALKGRVPALRTEQTDATLKAFESFVEDYVLDLRETKSLLEEVSNSINAVDDFAKIYDVLASQLHRYEVANLFVKKMSRQLSENACTEER